MSVIRQYHLNYYFWILYLVILLNLQNSFNPNGQTTKRVVRKSTPRPTTKFVRKRTQITMQSMHTDCDYKAFDCMKAYRTGKVCARTFYYNFQTFKNWCMLAYINCVERYQMWRPVHMGECLEIPHYKLEGKDWNYRFSDEWYLKQTYVEDIHEKIL